MIISQISAMAKNRVIGVKNSLPWNLPEDLKFFKEKTKGKIMIMGRNTFESLPGVLPLRFHIVISKEHFGHSNPLVQSVTSIADAFELAEKLQQQIENPWPKEVYIVGGGEIYRQTLQFVDFVYLTIIDKEYDGDVFFPELTANFQLIEKSDRTEPMNFSFCTFKNNQKVDYPK